MNPKERADLARDRLTAGFRGRRESAEHYVPPGSVILTAEDATVIRKALRWDGSETLRAALALLEGQE